MEIGEYKEWLKTLPTKRLLGMRSYHFGYYMEDDEYEKARLEDNAVYAELNTREHVPNKVEAKVSRKQAIGRQKRNGGRKGYGR